MIDLGKDVPVEEFVEKVRAEQADFVCMSTLMTTSMNNMQRVIESLKEQGLREQVKIMVGGGPISQNFADKIGADGYSVTAVEAVKLADRLSGV